LKHVPNNKMYRLLFTMDDTKLPSIFLRVDEIHRKTTLYQKREGYDRWGDRSVGLGSCLGGDLITNEDTAGVQSGSRLGLNVSKWVIEVGCGKLRSIIL